MTESIALWIAYFALAVGLFAGYSVGWCVGWWRRGRAERRFWGTEAGRRRFLTVYGREP